MFVPHQHAASILSRCARTLLPLLVVVASSAAAPTAVAQPATLRLEILGPAATGFAPTAIDSRRRIAGVLAGTNVALKRGDVVDDRGPGYVWAMDDYGRLFGSRKNANGIPQAVMWSRQGELVALSPDGTSASANGANRRGDAVGEIAFRATVWTRGEPTDLGPGVAKDINNLGDIAGGELEGPNMRAALWQGGARTRLSQNNSFAYAINDAAQVVGVEHGNPSSARLWQAGQTVNLGAGFALDSLAYDINGVGDIVGYYRFAPDVIRAVVWRKGADGAYAATDLDTFLRPEAVAAGWTLYSAIGINDRGDIIGFATNQILCGRGACDAYGFVLTRSRLPDDFPVPTP
jgi:uncharacterized membrane protein